MTDTPEVELVDEDELSVSPLELFFDLVFVFAIAQIAAFVRHDLTWSGVGKGVLLVVLVYWAWSLYTWGLNATGTSHVYVRLALLSAMGTILLMAVALPSAFTEDGWHFAAALVAFRLIGTGMYYLAAGEEQRAAFSSFFPLATLGAAVTLVGGFMDPSVRPWVWLGAIAVDVLATRAAERADWHVRPAHFAERYGLLVIIVLGELIVAIGVGLGDFEITTSLGVTLSIAFVVVAALWWSYFDRASGFLEETLRTRTGIERGRFARDAYTGAHLPLVIGIAMFAVALEEVVVHPDEHIEAIAAVLLAGGITLVIVSFLLAGYSATRQIPVERLTGAAVIIAITAIAWGSISSRTLLALHAVVLVTTLIVEYRRWSDDWQRRAA
ncbi:MAG: low temperature requirement protein A [Acidimicrobiia bacterium]|nr:low temperature requirement protein A [Acidimicrobiia bacterium]NNF70137.1 low temperature requirement protein A [Acidimicrobiia bacterium]NNK91199.1 low temperature requirement protein A [Acidimicrobiia bacterium]